MCENKCGGCKKKSDSVPSEEQMKMEFVLNLVTQVTASLASNPEFIKSRESMEPAALAKYLSDFQEQFGNHVMDTMEPKLVPVTPDDIF